MLAWLASLRSKVRWEFICIFRCSPKTGNLGLWATTSLRLNDLIPASLGKGGFRLGAGFLGTLLGLRFGSVTGSRYAHSCAGQARHKLVTPKDTNALRSVVPKPKNPRSDRPHYFLKRSPMTADCPMRRVLGISPGKSLRLFVSVQGAHRLVEGRGFVASGGLFPG
jgi:hypothetical protein